MLRYLQDIKSWIICFFLLRLYHISQPPLEQWHEWRQAYTAAVARNYYEEGINLFFPHVNHAGMNGGGIAGTEFPLFNALIALFSQPFGYADGWGRFINLVVSSIGIYFFYRIIDTYISPLIASENKEETSETKPFPSLAFFSTLVLLSSIWFDYSRKIMPDTFSVALVLIGIFYGLEFLYTEKNKWKNLSIYFIFTTLGILCKMPAVSVVTLLAVPLLDKNVEISKKIWFIGTSAIVAAFFGAWYFAWVPYLVAKYNNQLFFPTHLKEGALQIWGEKYETIRRFTDTALFSKVGVFAALVGLFLVLKSRKLPLFLGLGLMCAMFFAYALKTGVVFATHTYYIIPLVPMLAFFAGTALHWLASKKEIAAYLLVGVIMAQGIYHQALDFDISPQYQHYSQLEKLADKYSPNKNDLIFVTGNHTLNPAPMYHTHRRGWVIAQEQFKDPQYIKGLTGWPPKIIFFDKINNQGTMPYKILYEDDFFRVYDSKQPLFDTAPPATAATDASINNPRLDGMIKKVHNTPEWLGNLTVEAKKNHRNIDSLIRANAIWMMDEEDGKHK